MTQAVVGPSDQVWLDFLFAISRDNRDQVKDHLQKCPTLISHVAHIETITEERTTALSFASSRPGRSHVVQILLDAKADPNLIPTGNTSEHPLCSAVACRAFDSAELLIKAKADPNLRIKELHERPILHYATTMSGSLSVIQSLIAHKASVNATDSLGSSALYCYAMGLDKEPYVDALLEAGAEVEENASEFYKRRQAFVMSRFPIKATIEEFLGRHLTAIVLNYLYK